MIIKLLADAVLINASFVLAYQLRFKYLLFIAPPGLPIFEQYLRVLVFVTLLWLAVFKLVGLYEGKRFTALIDELAALFWGVTLSSLLLLGLLFLYKEYWVSRLVVVNAWWLAFVLLSAGRLLLFRVNRWLRQKGWGCKNTLILGAGEMGETLAQKMQLDAGLGYRVAGFLDDDPSRQGQQICGLLVFGPLSLAKETIISRKIDEVIIADFSLPAARVLDIITECEKTGVEFKLVPGILELIASRVDADELAGIPLLTVSEIRLQGLNAGLKRSVDVVASAVGLLILSPLFLVVAGIIKLTSPGPVIFHQARIGLDGKRFEIYKFRSMRQDAEALLPQLEHLSETAGHLFKIKDDPRITPFGKLIRRASIDELLQLVNVLFGDMSLVGPRPPLSREVDQYNSWQMKRLRVRPGITGPWQVSGRSLLPFDDMVRLDIYYIENWSLWLDLKILMRTIPVVLFSRGAY